MNCSESLNGTCIKCSEGAFLTKNNKCVETNHCILSDDYYRCEECEISFFYNYTCNECVDDKEFEQKFKICKNIDYIGENCFECRNILIIL